MTLVLFMHTNAIEQQLQSQHLDEHQLVVLPGS